MLNTIKHYSDKITFQQEIMQILENTKEPNTQNQDCQIQELFKEENQKGNLNFILASNLKESISFLLRAYRKLIMGSQDCHNQAFLYNRSLYQLTFFFTKEAKNLLFQIILNGNSLNQNDFDFYLSQLNHVGFQKNNMEEQTFVMKIMIQFCKNSTNEHNQAFYLKKIKRQLFNIGINPNKISTLLFFQSNSNNKFYVNVFKNKNLSLFQISKQNGWLQKYFPYESNSNSFSICLENLRGTPNSSTMVKYISTYLFLILNLSLSYNEDFLNNVKNIGLEKDFVCSIVQQENVHQQIKQKILKLYVKVYLHSNQKIFDFDIENQVYDRIQKLNEKELIISYLRKVETSSDKSNSLFDVELIKKYFAFNFFLIQPNVSKFELVHYLKFLATLILYLNTVVENGYLTPQNI